MAEKVVLVSGAREACGPGPGLLAVGLSRSTWCHHTGTKVPHAEKYAHLEVPSKAIAEAHPEYGHRRPAPELGETYGHRVQRKVVERLRRLWDLPLRRAVTRPKPSVARRTINAADRWRSRTRRDNPKMESCFGRFKVENRSLILDAGSLEELAAVVEDRIGYYNRVRRHSSLGDRPPLKIIEDFYREGWAAQYTRRCGVHSWGSLRTHSSTLAPSVCRFWSSASGQPSLS